MAGPNRRGLILTFDAFGTLFRPRDAITTQYREEATKFGVSLSKHLDADLEKAFMKAYNRMKLQHPNHGAGHNGIGYEVWWKNVVMDTLKPFATDKKLPDELGNSLVHRFSTSVGYELYPDVLPLLDAITSTGNPPSWRYPSAITRASTPTHGEISTVLGILSNGDPRVSLILESLGVGHYFSFQTLSYDSGSAKPSREIFRIARQAGLRIGTGSPNLNTRDLATGEEDRNTWKGWDYVHVGDDINEDWCAARKLKFIQPVWIDRLAKREKTSFQKFQKAVNSGIPPQLPHMAAGMQGWADKAYTLEALAKLRDSVWSDSKSQRAINEFANCTITDLKQLTELFPPIPDAAETLEDDIDPDIYYDNMEAKRKARLEQAQVSKMKKRREVKAMRALKKSQIKQDRIQRHQERMERAWGIVRTEGKESIKRTEEKEKIKMNDIRDYRLDTDEKDEKYGSYDRSDRSNRTERNDLYEHDRIGRYSYERDDRIGRNERDGTHEIGEGTFRPRFEIHRNATWSNRGKTNPSTSSLTRNEFSDRQQQNYRIGFSNPSDEKDNKPRDSQGAFTIRRGFQNLTGRLFGNRSSSSDR